MKPKEGSKTGNGPAKEKVFFGKVRPGETRQAFTARVLAAFKARGLVRG